MPKYVFFNVDILSVAHRASRARLPSVPRLELRMSLAKALARSMAGGYTEDASVDALPRSIAVVSKSRAIQEGGAHAAFKFSDPIPLKTNLSYGELLLKAIERDDAISARQEAGEDWSPRSLSPLTLATPSMGISSAYFSSTGSIESSAYSSSNTASNTAPSPLSASPPSPLTPLTPLAQSSPRRRAFDGHDPGFAEALADLLQMLCHGGKSPVRTGKRGHGVASQPEDSSTEAGGQPPSTISKRRRKHRKGGGQTGVGVEEPPPPGPREADTALHASKSKRGCHGPRTDEQQEASKDGARRRRKKARQAKAAQQEPLDKEHAAPFAEKPPKHRLLPLQDFDAVRHAVSESAYTGSWTRRKRKSRYTAADLERLGFEDFRWDGITSYAVLDTDDRIIAVLVGKPHEGALRPENQTWGASMARLARRFEEERSCRQRAFNGKNGRHRRGTYGVVSIGWSFGGGQKIPGRLRSRGGQKKIARALMRDPDLVRLAGYGSEALAAYFPKAYEHMRSRLKVLQRSQPSLRMNFRNSAYPTCTLNLGPHTVTRAHNDCTNYPGVPCAISAFGDFDPDEGGELYLVDVKLKIRFPPGATILLSSAGIRHGNLPIKRGQRRYSFTQYCVGGLIRWASYGCRPAKSLSAQDRAVLDREQCEGWGAQLARFSKHGELQEDRRWLQKLEAGRRV